jgi:hypothetical protein
MQICNPKLPLCETPFLTRVLGTTNSAVAIMEGKAPKIIENSEGKSLTTSSSRHPNPNSPFQVHELLHPLLLSPKTESG